MAAACVGTMYCTVVDGNLLVASCNNTCNTLNVGSIYLRGCININVFENCFARSLTCNNTYTFKRRGCCIGYRSAYERNVLKLSYLGRNRSVLTNVGEETISISLSISYSDLNSISALPFIVLNTREQEVS